MLLTLKLLLVPLSVLLVTLAGWRWGPRVAGWLGGMPVIAGPILLLLALEQGAGFAASAAEGAVASVFAFVAFAVAYARLAPRLPWTACYGLSVLVWALAAAALVALALPFWGAFALAGVALLAAPRLIPAGAGKPAQRTAIPELGLRMFAGAALAWVVTSAAGAFGPLVSGVLTVFPVLGSVLAVCSHRAQGAAFVVPLLRGMSLGLAALFAFCATLALSIGQGLMLGFALAVLVGTLVQLATGGYFRKLLSSL